MPTYKVAILLKSVVEAASKERAVEVAKKNLSLDDAFIDCVRSAEPGMMVNVWDSARTQLLGVGVYEGDVDVYFAVNDETQEAMSKQDPTEDIAEADLPAGFRVEKTKSPKIVLNTGLTVYGCQVWWEVIDED